MNYYETDMHESAEEHLAALRSELTTSRQHVKMLKDKLAMAYKAVHHKYERIVRLSQIISDLENKINSLVTQIHEVLRDQNVCAELMGLKLRFGGLMCID